MRITVMPTREDREVSRKQAAFLLKCSLSQIQSFELQGKLHARRENSRVWYSFNEVQELAKKYKPTRQRVDRVDLKLLGNLRGKIASRVFQMLEQGHSLREIVIACEVDPLIVRQLWDEWQLDFDDARKAAEKKRQADIEREEQRRYERRIDMAEWRKVKLEEIKLTRELKLAGIGVGAAADTNKKESA